MDKRIIIIGNTSNANLVHYFFTRDSAYTVEAFSVEREYIQSSEFCGLEVVPLEDLESRFPPEEYDAFVAVGYTQMNKVREKLYDQVKAMGYHLPNYISSKCSFLTDEKIGDNNLILEDNTIQPFVKIGSNNVLWSGNHIGHDVQIEDHCYITSHVVISGFTKIRHHSFLGVNSTFRDDIEIAPFTLIGAGVTVNSNTSEGDILLPPKPFKMEKKSWDIKI
ncbi:acetyltransferase [Roseivirga sp.]|uniref:acetyltransferase n=1 Tax=Roseivirga sp. TaxID=1964215 RepID=UPI003B8DF9A2